MTYEIDILPAATKEMAGLPENIRRQVDKRILALAAQPRPPGTKKLSGYENLYRQRVGDYRIVYRIEDNRLVVTIVRVRHRSTAYRGM